MAYYTGTAASISALRDALLAHAQADGWTLVGDVLSKSGVYFRIQVNADNNLTILGCESDAVANPAPELAHIGNIYGTGPYSSSTTHKINYPATYHFFGFSQEAYFVVNYDTTFYQWLAFGKTTVSGLPGQGGWFGASVGAYLSQPYSNGPVNIDPDGNCSVYGDLYAGSPALFWTNSHYYQGQRNYWVNHNLDGLGWRRNLSTLQVSSSYGAGHIKPLLGLQPSAWNSEAALLPLRAFIERTTGYKVSLVADLEHARTLRIDNLSPGEILTIGSSKWMVFPWYAKNTAERNGGQGKNHSGTLGWAIRYEGP